MKASNMIYSLLLVVVYLCMTEASFADYRPGNGIFQYQLSFAGPFGGTHVPFWETSGAAIVMDSYIRLTPNQRSQRGAIWSNRPLRAKDFEIMVRFSIGSDTRLGADGLGVWITKDRAVTGPIMGNADKWSGIGVIVDTFDNDGQRDNPQIYAVYNDNWFTFVSSDDGKMNGLGICQANIRQITKNPENKFVKLVIRLQEKVLTILYDNSEITGTEPAWTECLSATVPIPDDPSGSYYLGVTAETGGLSDFHDIKSVTTWSLKTLDSLLNEQPPARYKSDEKKVPPPVVPEVVKPPKTYVASDTLKEATASEIVNRLAELEKKDDAFALTIDGKFKEMQQKLESMERDQLNALTRIFQNVDSIRSAVDVSKLIELKEDVKNTFSSLNHVKERIDNIESHVEGTKERTADLQNLHDTKATELRELVEKNSSWGFWTYFIIFQVLFWGAFALWRRSEKPQEKKFL